MVPGRNAWIAVIAIACSCSFSGHGKDTRIDGGGGDDTGDGGPQGPWLDGWMYRRAIILQASQIDAPAADGELAKFPVMIALSDVLLGTRALADRRDLAFTSADETTRLPHEIESVDSTETIAWVSIPHLSSTVDTTIYVYYGNANAPSYTPADVWSDNFIAVYHLQQDPGPNTPGAILDATAIARNATAESLDPQDGVAAQVGRGVHYNGSDSCITTPTIDVGAKFTISAWVNMDATGEIHTLVANSQDNSDTNGFRFFLNSNGANDRKILFETGNGSASGSAITPSNAFVAGQWEHIAAIVDAAAATVTIVVDGEIANTDTSIRGDFNPASTIEIGRMKNNNPFPGTLDELEISSTMRSVEWLRTSYHNQKTPPAFYTIADEQPR